MLDARESQPMDIDFTCFRVYTDKLVVPDERHESAAHQTSPELDKSRADRRSKSREGSTDLGTTVWYPLHPYPVPS